MRQMKLAHGQRRETGKETAESKIESDRGREGDRITNKGKRTQNADIDEKQNQKLEEEEQHDKGTENSVSV